MTNTLIRLRLLIGGESATSQQNGSFYWFLEYAW